MAIWVSTHTSSCRPGKEHPATCSLQACCDCWTGSNVHQCFEYRSMQALIIGVKYSHGSQHNQATDQGPRSKCPTQNARPEAASRTHATDDSVEHGAAAELAATPLHLRCTASMPARTPEQCRHNRGLRQGCSTVEHHVGGCVCMSGHKYARCEPQEGGQAVVIMLDDTSSQSSCKHPVAAINAGHAFAPHLRSRQTGAGWRCGTAAATAPPATAGRPPSARARG